jgi:arginyl-tRNA synthetase
MLKQVKKQITQQLSAALGGQFSEEQIASCIEIPPKQELGDFAFPCYKLAQQSYKGPKEQAGKEIAKLAGQLSALIKENVKTIENIAKIDVKGPYINFYIDDSKLIKYTLDEAFKGKDYGKSDIGQGKLVVIDYSAPNFGKPMHVGHIRSTILGDSLIKVLNFVGYKTQGINYFGDIGLHMGKLIAAYQLWGNPSEIEADPEKAMLDLYVRYTKLETEEKEKYGIKEVKRTESIDFDEENKESAEEVQQAPATKQAQQILEKLESGDPELIAIWQKIGAWSQVAFNRVYDLLDVKFDETVGQSNFTQLGKEQVWKARRLDVAHTTSSGAIEAALADEGLPNKIILKQDGTALYSTQDLGAATNRFEKYKFDKMVYVVAYEQNTYFKQIFKLLEKMGYNWAKDCYHYSFGLISLEEGKMSTREGNVVFLEEVLNKAINLSKQEIDKRNPNLQNKENVAKTLGIGAIKYMILSVDPIKDIAFSWSRALDFDSNSAPYIQYACARANSLLRKAGDFPKTLDNYVLEMPQEKDLVKKIAQFPLLVETAAQPPYKLNILANYATVLATSFNQFYKDVPVLTAENNQTKYSRLILVDAFKTTLENTLGLMGIHAPEQM